MLRNFVGTHLNFAGHLQIETRILQVANAAATLVDFAYREPISQIFLMRSARRGWRFFHRPNLTSEILRLARDMQATVAAERKPIRDMV